MEGRLRSFDGTTDQDPLYTFSMKQLDIIADEIDQASDDKDVQGLQNALDKIQTLLDTDDQTSEATLYYYRANAFAALRAVKPDFPEVQFQWHQSELSDEILSLRIAIASDNFLQLDLVRCCQIYTNLGNALNAVGRPIEALAAWDQALQIIPTFAMAAANRAHGLCQYQAGLYDSGHQCLILAEAARSFEIALSDKAFWDGDYPSTVKQQFHNKLSQIQNYLEGNCDDLKDFDPNAFELGQNDETIALNTWRLRNRLFLNPLNDLGELAVASQDVFHLPNHLYTLDEKVRFPHYYDQIKQEYVAACVLLWEGLSETSVHPTDDTLLTFEHGDYSVTSIQIEKQKVAFRMAYSLLDKCGVFINDYFALGQDPKSLATSFRKVWFKRGKKTLLENLPVMNWRLRGIYAISLDLFDEQFSELTSPVAKSANDLRNAAEHRFVSIHEETLYDDVPDLFEPISVSELEELALHMLKLARSTIMGLSFAMNHQEQYINQPTEDKLTVPISKARKKRNRSHQ